MKTRPLAAAAAAPALILALGAGASAAPNGGVRAVAGTVTSSVRAGYEAVANGSTVTSLHYVQATFTVPSLNCMQTPAAYSAQTVVLAAASFTRFVSNSAATEIVESCQGGSPAYSADATYASDSDCSHNSQLPVAVSPGDAVKLALASGSGSVTYTVSDLTTGATASSSSDSCSSSKAAGIFSSAAGFPVADFTQAAFHQIQVQATGQATPQPLASPGWTINKYALRGPSGRDDVKPEALLSGTFTSAFANDWLAPN
jgi:Peptidase A4 family